MVQLIFAQIKVELETTTWIVNEKKVDINRAHPKSHTSRDYQKFITMKNPKSFRSSSFNLLLLMLPLFSISVIMSSCAESAQSSMTEEAEAEAVAAAELSSADAIRAEQMTNKNMYVIERTIPGAGNFTQEELKGISQVSCGVLDEMGSDIKWLHSYVTGDKIYCVYTAPNEDMIREHAKKGGFPADAVAKVGTVIDPSTAED
jgi:hypothetical protein